MNTLGIYIEKGKKIGHAEGQNQKTEKVVYNLIQVSTWSDEQIAAVAEVPVEYVIQMRANIQESK